MTTGRARPGLRRAAYGLTLFATSAGALILEIVAGRMLAPYVGMSLYTWTAVIAVVLAGLSLGHWLGGELARHGNPFSFAVVVLSLTFAAITAGATLLLLRALSGPILHAGLGTIGGITMLTAAVFFAPSAFVGVVSPVLTKLALDEAPDKPGRVVGQMYALGALGSIVGTLTAGFLLIAWLGSAASILVVAGGYAILAGCFLLYTPITKVGKSIGMLALGTAYISTLASGNAAGALESPCLEESHYYCIRIVDYTPISGRPSALMVLDHMGHGINDRDDPSLLHSEYIHLTHELVMARGHSISGEARFNAFFIGGGAYTLPRAWAARFPQSTLTVAEIDPAVTRIAHNAMWLESSSNLRIVHQDARVFLQSTAQSTQWDIVVGDAFRDIAVPPHLVTVEFAREIALRLKSGGAYILTVIDQPREPRFLFSTLKTLRQVFPQVEVWVEAEQLSRSSRLTFVVLAGDEATPTNQVSASDTGITRTWVRWPAHTLWPEAAASGAPVLTDDYAPVHRLLYQVLEAAS